MNIAKNKLKNRMKIERLSDTIKLQLNGEEDLESYDFNEVLETWEGK